MAGDVSFRVDLDRSSNLFDLILDYYIPGYSDPETGEYFGNTSWNYTFTNLDTGQSGGTGGYAAEGDSVWIVIGLGPDLDLHSYTLSFYAQNTFSADSASFELSIFSAANATVAQQIEGSAGADLILGGEAGDQLDGLQGNDQIEAGPGADALSGGDGADQLDGGSGADTMSGNAGDDLYRVDDPDDAIVERAGEGNDSVIATVSYTLSAQLERLALAGLAPIDGSGNALGNRIDGNAAANVLNGRAGDDELRGGAGSDQLHGALGNDTLRGEAGADTLNGGAGDDTYYIDAPVDLIVEQADQGFDTVIGYGLNGYRLPEHVEGFVTGIVVFPDISPAILVVGNALHNSLYGGSGDDTLRGGAGHDQLDGYRGDDLLPGDAGADALTGGAGIDTVRYAASATAVTVRLDLGDGAGGDADGDTLIEIENVVGSAFDDLLVGDARANQLRGGAGDDEIRGGLGADTVSGAAGADTLAGEAGRDTLSYAGSSDALNIDLALAQVSGGDGEGDAISGFESAIGGTGADTLVGSVLANELLGGAGADSIAGGAGSDTIAGGSGGDTLVGGGGTDTLSYAVSIAAVSVSLAGVQQAEGGHAQGDAIGGFENLIGGRGDDTIAGSSGRNLLAGRAGADNIDGAGGNDTIAGGAGADTLFGGAGIDTLSYAGSSGPVSIDLGAQSASYNDAAGDVLSGFENAEGGGGGDYLRGSAGANRLQGAAGYDAIEGGAGNDTLSGGADSDTFLFYDGFGHDTITDFDGELLQINAGAAWDSFDELMSAATEIVDGGSHVVFDLGSAGTITVLHATLADFSADSFLFG